MSQCLRALRPVLLILGLCSCSLDIPVENELTDPNAITSVQTAYEALSSAYTSYPKEAYHLSLLSDDFVPTFTASQDPSSYRLYRSWQRVSGGATMRPSVTSLPYSLGSQPCAPPSPPKSNTSSTT